MRLLGLKNYEEKQKNTALSEKQCSILYYR